MEYEDLMRSMEESSEERKAEIIKKAGEFAAKIKEEANAKADEIKKMHMSGAKNAIEIERNKKLYLTKSDIKKGLISLKYEFFNKAFEMAREKIKGIRDRPEYENCFKKIFFESVEALGSEDVVIHIDKRDEELCKRVMQSLNSSHEVITDLECEGGLNVSTKDGKIMIFNTLSARLENAKQRLRQEIFSKLYGD